MFYVYFLKNSKGTLYIGQTNNLSARESQQISRSTKSAKFIKDSIEEFGLVYYEEYPTRLEAMRRKKTTQGMDASQKRSTD